MHPDRPDAEPVPCPQCGRRIDALRAGRVVMVATDAHYLCDDACADRFRKEARTQQRLTPPPALPAPSETDRVREATLPRIAIRRDTETAAHRAVFAPKPVPLPWSGLALAITGFVLALVAEDWRLALGAVTCIVAAAAVALIRGQGARTDLGVVAWAAGPIGAVLAAVAGALAHHESGQHAGLAGAALAAGAMVARSWLDLRARRPVAEVVHDLAARMPPRARVPAGDSDSRYEEIPTGQVHAGAELLVVEGETVPVDGVVVSGEAAVLLHPIAVSPVHIKAGAKVLAGSRVASGTLRVSARRVGQERALVQPAHFGDVEGPGAARIARLADRVTRYGGLIALLAAPLGLALTGDPDLPGRLSAAAAVLLAAPLLAARRGAESPFVAAAASAGGRGILYRDARSMEAAGRVGTAALCTSGVITEGRPEVVEMHTLGDADASELLALIAGAESRVDAHPIAQALLRHAAAKGVKAAIVRRVHAIAGRGVTAVTQKGNALVVGTRQLLLDEGISVAVADATAERAESRGQKALFVGLEGRVRAVLFLQDSMRPGVRAAVQRIFDLDVEVVLLSGDHRASVEAIAGPLDVTNVKAELPPAEQKEAVEQMRGSGALVATAGTLPLNGAPLEAADVPIYLDHAALPESDKGVAIATADVRDAAAALWIAKAARKEATRGVALAVGAGGVLVTGAALGWVVPAAAAAVAVAVDAFALPAGARLLRRIELRLPAR